MRRRNIRALALSAVLLAFAPAALAGETLTLPGCVAQALSNHPSLTAAEGTVEANKARTSLAAVAARTKVNGTAGYTLSATRRV